MQCVGIQMSCHFMGGRGYNPWITNDTKRPYFGKAHTTFGGPGTSLLGFMAPDWCQSVGDIPGMRLDLLHAQFHQQGT